MSSRGLNKNMDTLFPQSSPEECRVCNEPVVDGRWSYCSVRCREIARAVQRMFIWDCVREQILQRDDYTCQSCGEFNRNGLHVDHIERLVDGGHKFDEGNLQTLCEECHISKTANENTTSERPEVTLDDYFDLDC